MSDQPHEDYRLALVHEHLVQDGGAERVLRTLMKGWPHAPIYALVYNAASMGPDFIGKDIRTSGWQRVPGAVKRYKWLLPFIDGAYRSMDLNGYDVILSDASGFAKSVRTPAGAVHVCYCHTPTRYLWSSSESYIRDTGYPGPVKWLFGKLRQRLRRQDLRAAGGVDVFIANSSYVAERIKRYYDRDATVINPPVDIDAFQADHPKQEYLLVATRLEPYKRVDLAIQAANALKRPLKVMGSGTEETRLRKLAGPTVEFTGRVTDTERAKLFGEAAALVHSQDEDFGITMVEALASGTPVVAFDRGGASEILRDGQTGILFKEQTEDSLTHALNRLEETSFDPQVLRSRAEDFSEDRFLEQLRTVIEQARTDVPAGR